MGWRSRALGGVRRSLPPLVKRLSDDQRLALAHVTWRAIDSTSTLAGRLQLRRGFVERYCAVWPTLPAETERRIFGLFDAVRACAAVPGDIVECGVGRGATLVTLARASAMFSPQKQVIGFDSFSGFPPATEHDLGGRVTAVGIPTGWEDTSPALVSSALDEPAELVAGLFADTLPDRLPEAISLLHVDCDLYGSTGTVLRAGLPRVSAGGLVVFDEYGDERWPGATRAVDEAAADYDFRITWSDALGRHLAQL